ncbi:MAG: hypothetical protein ABUK01_08635 [Leptospirales bacterium]
MIKKISYIAIMPVLVLLMLTGCGKDGGETTVKESDGLACVTTISPGGVCTEDINECGFASSCECPKGYGYNSDIGKCLLNNIANGAPGKKVPVGKCAVKPTGACAQVINECGVLASCGCPDGFKYDDRSGMCLKN